MGSRLESNVSRRTVLKWLGAAAAGASMGPVLSGLSRLPVARAASPVDLEFTVWSYSIETILQNIARFEALTNNAIKVRLSDVSWTAFHETMVARFTGRTAPDVLYCGGDWLSEFATAGWVVPLEDYWPKLRSHYVDMIVPFALQDMTFQGKAYGLPYYADLITFMYDEEALARNGISAPPATWEELTEQAALLKSKGMERPIALEFAAIMPTTLETFTAMVFSRGGELFDENYNPIFDRPGSPGWEQLRWLADNYRNGLIQLLPHETDVVKAMGAGRHAFTVLYNYNLAALNDKATSPRAGHFKLGLMPGSTHETYGFAKFYTMTAQAVRRGQAVIDAVIRFIEYFGGQHNGEFPVAKVWAVEKGLGFGLLPLYDDEDVRRSFSQWIDIDLLRRQATLARARRQAVPWYGVWGEFARLQLLRAVTGEASVQEATQAMAQQARELKLQFG